MKKMELIKISLIGLIALSVFSCNSSNKKTESKTSTINKESEKTDNVKYQIDTDVSVIHWKGSMIGVYAHEGDLKLKSGNFSLNNSNIVEGEFTVDVNSMITTDDDALYKMAPREKLIGHLKSADFFDTENFPTAIFKITKVNGNEVFGNLTIKGKTNEEKLTNVKVQDNHLSGLLTIDRQKYGVTYKNKMNDMILSDDLELNVEITGKK